MKSNTPQAAKHFSASSERAPECSRSQAIDPAVMALSEKVRLVASDRVSGTHQGVLTVALADGTTLSAERSQPKGWAENPVGRTEVEAKFWRNIAFAGTVSRARAERALDMIDRLETLEDAGALTECLTA